MRLISGGKGEGEGEEEQKAGEREPGGSHSQCRRLLIRPVLTLTNTNCWLRISTLSARTCGILPVFRVFHSPSVGKRPQATVSLYLHFLLISLKNFVHFVLVLVLLSFFLSFLLSLSLSPSFTLLLWLPLSCLDCFNDSIGSKYPALSLSPSFVLSDYLSVFLLLFSLAAVWKSKPNRPDSDS